LTFLKAEAKVTPRQGIPPWRIRAGAQMKTLTFAAAYQGHRKAKSAINDPTYPESEFKAREALWLRASDGIGNAEVTSEQDIIAAVAYAKELSDDGAFECCSAVLDKVLSYHHRVGA
jgi:hypothetical protein